MTWNPETKNEAAVVLLGLAILAKSKGDPSTLTADERADALAALRTIRRASVRPS